MTYTKFVGFALSIFMLAAAASAAEQQFYFVAKHEPGGLPSANSVVYLRWDPMEGKLPDSVVKIRLMRNGSQEGDWVQLGADWPVNEVASAAAIAALYAPDNQRRMRLETITRLNELATDAGVAFSPSQFAERIHGLIDPTNIAPADPSPEQALWAYSPLWAHFGARTDFNVAQARRRAWVDINPGVGSVRYQLRAEDANGLVAALGELQVDLTQATQALGASNFRQIILSDRSCDLPESGKDDYTVMLHWQAAGQEVASDKVAAQVYLSGYDLYRSLEQVADNVIGAPVRDIAALAKTVSVNSRGEPEIPGLEKVNVALLLDPGKDSIEEDWLLAKQAMQEYLTAKGEVLPAVDPNDIPVEPKWVEARDLLQRAGLKPGDRRYYYLVARDFTGAYGPTVGEVIEVPDMARPPAPWNLRSFADETSLTLGKRGDSYHITWDQVSLESYLRLYQGSRLFCNVPEARVTGVLEYVPFGADCETSQVRNRVRLDVSDYRVYRFTDFDLAGRFKDSDGDGVGDLDETPDLDGSRSFDAFERSLGTQCDWNQQPAGARNFLVSPEEPSIQSQVKPTRAVVESSGAPTRFAAGTARLYDEIPALKNGQTNNRGGIYWYRIVSEAGNDAPVGRLSFMSAPQRGMFPDREPPLPPNVEMTTTGNVPDGCDVEVDPTAPWGVEEEIADDGKGPTFSFSCASGSFTLNDLNKTVSALKCENLAAQCDQATGITMSTTGTAATGGKECVVKIPNNVDLCQSGSINVVPTYVLGSVDIKPGELLSEGAEVVVTPRPGTCIAFYENMDGTATRIGSTCDAGGLRYQPRAGMFCGYAVATDQNNNVSAVVHIPCTIAPVHAKAPSPPQILTFNVDGDLARGTFRLPAEQIAVALARMDYEPGDGSRERVVESIPVIDNEPGEAIGFSIPVDALTANRDRFCLQMLSVARDEGKGKAKNSEWTPPVCFTRSDSGEDIPEYLPWPAVKAARKGAPIGAALFNNYRKVPPFLAVPLLTSTELTNDCQAFWPQLDLNNPLPESQLRDFDQLNCLAAGANRFRALLTNDFIVYRQSRINGGEASNWIQVSPLIDYVHFDRYEFNDRIYYYLNDPFIKITGVRSAAGANPGDSLAIWFVDRYPFVPFSDVAKTQKYEWRYQVVYFDRDHTPVEWRESVWFAELQL